MRLMEPVFRAATAISLQVVAALRVKMHKLPHVMPDKMQIRALVLPLVSLPTRVHVLMDRMREEARSAHPAQTLSREPARAGRTREKVGAAPG